MEFITAIILFLVLTMLVVSYRRKKVDSATLQDWANIVTVSAGISAIIVGLIAGIWYLIGPVQLAFFQPTATPNDGSITNSVLTETSIPAAIPGTQQPGNYRCEDLNYIKLKVGDNAKVILDTTNLRSTPEIPESFDANIVAVLEDGDTLTIIAGPECANESTWWKVRANDGYKGWIQEHLSNGYQIVP